MLRLDKSHRGAFVVDPDNENDDGNPTSLGEIMTPNSAQPRHLFRAHDWTDIGSSDLREIANILDGLDGDKRQIAQGIY